MSSGASDHEHEVDIDKHVRVYVTVFVSLMGRSEELPGPEFALLETFVMSVVYPPNPNRNLDGSLPDPPTGPNPTNGELLFRSGDLEHTGNR